ncbi:MAG: LacI family DNA-binding transcriptional regulator [Brevinema sp.]
MKKISIRDVARLAGVSTTTVSFVYHTPNRVHSKTRESVLKAAETLGYIPNISASGLRGHSNLVALVINFSYDEIHHPTVIEALPYISQALKEYGYHTMVFFQHHNDESKELRSLVKTKQLAGVLFLASRSDLSLLECFIENNIPVTTIGTLEQYQNKIYCVDNDNIKDTFNLVKQIHHLGYKKIAFLSGDLDYIVCQQRLEGYRNAIHELQDHEPIIFGYCEERKKLEQSIQEIMSLDSKPDAIITKDDIKGIYTINQLLKLGIKPGNDVGVGSIGGISATTYTTPQLSSMSFSIKEITQKAVNATHQNIVENKSQTGIHFVSSLFIERGSLNRNFSL